MNLKNGQIIIGYFLDDKLNGKCQYIPNNNFEEFIDGTFESGIL
jgi:hypothetical protein